MKIILITSLAWLFIPKFTLVEIPGYSQGLRIEDILFLISLFFRLLNFNNRIYIYKFPFIGNMNGVYLILYLLFFELCSILILDASIVILIFGLRWFEYFIMGGLIMESVYYYKNIFINFIKSYIIINFIYSIVFFILNGFNGRYAGITEGPWEITSVLIFLYLGIRQYISDKEKYFYLIIIISICVFSQARIQLIAIVLIYFKFYAISKKQIFFTLPIFFPLIFFSNEFIFSALRFSDLNLDSFKNILFLIQERGRDLSWNEVSDFDGVDSSSLSRLIIWLSFIYPWIDAGYYGIFFGIGGGFGGVVVDGFYIRLVTELGIFGSYLFYLWYKNVVKNTPAIFFTAILIVSIVIAISNDPITSQRIFTSFVVAVALNKIYSSTKLLNYH